MKDMIPINDPLNNSKHMASLYVGDLHPEVTESMIYKKFSTCGAIVSIRICRDMITRKSLGYAYVNFQNTADAESAMNRLNFDKIKGRPIRIMWSQRDSTLRKSGIGNIFIKNLDKSISLKQLHDTFVGFGQILSCKIALDHYGRSKGYGFVHFKTEQSATNAIKAIDGLLMKDRKLFVSHFIARDSRSISGNGSDFDCGSGGDRDGKFTNCFIKNFGDDLDDGKLLDMFREFGEITNSKVMMIDDYDQDNDDRNKISDHQETDCTKRKRSKGYGFVCFRDPASAQRAIKSLNGKSFLDRQLFVGWARNYLQRRDELLLQNFKKKNSREQCSSDEVGLNLLVKNLDDSIDDWRLKRIFETFGRVTNAKVMMDFINGSGLNGNLHKVTSCHGDGLQNFFKNDNHGGCYENKSRPYSFSTDSKTESAFRIDCHDNKSEQIAVALRSKGFGFVSFSNKEEAARAIIEMNRKKICGSRSLSVKLAQRKEDRKFRLRSRVIINSNWWVMSGRTSQIVDNFVDEPQMLSPARSTFPSGTVSSSISNNPSKNCYRHHEQRQLSPVSISEEEEFLETVETDEMQLGENANKMVKMKDFGIVSNSVGTNGNNGNQKAHRPILRAGSMREDNERREKEITNRSQTISSRGEYVSMTRTAQKTNSTNQTTGGRSKSEPIASVEETSLMYRRQQLGEKLYPLVHRIYPELAGKITGKLLLEIDNLELVHLMDSDSRLAEEIEQIMTKLRSNVVNTNCVKLKSIKSTTKPWDL